MNNHYLDDSAFSTLVEGLHAAFMRAATSTGTDLRDQLITTLAEAGILPASCRPDLSVSIPVHRDHGSEMQNAISAMWAKVRRFSPLPVTPRRLVIDTVTGAVREVDEEISTSKSVCRPGSRRF